MKDTLGQAEALVAQGDREGAYAIYQSLWTDATNTQDHYQACIAAHFLAHAHVEPEAQLEWHLRALRAADVVGDERVCTFYPSLHGNLADVYLRLGNRRRAREHLELARASEQVLQDNDYWHMLLQGLIERLSVALSDADESVSYSPSAATAPFLVE